MPPQPQRAAIGPIALVLALALAGCSAESPSSSLVDASPSMALTPSPRAGTTATDLSAIACATDDPTDVGELTGAWAGNDGGVYYIRHVGDCVWWFGTELSQIERGVTEQGGFANVASGRVNGPLIQVEWADIPLGNILGGGGLTLVYDEESDQLWITQQRGEWVPFGATVLTRIDPSRASPSPR